MVWQVLGVLALIAVACFAYGVFVERDSYRLRRVEAGVLPPGSKPIRVLHISDIHLLPDQRRKLRFIRSLRELHPDLVINTGDNIAAANSVRPLVEALGPLLAVPGAFVFGSNDYLPPRLVNPFSYLVKSSRPHNSGRELPHGELDAALSVGGWRNVMERRVLLRVGEVSVEVRGTDDPHHERDDYSRVAGAPEPGVLAIGVTHAPYSRVLNLMAADRLEIVFAGHTHGGQVCVPGYGALTTNCDLPTRQAKGLSAHVWGGCSMPLHVSAGLGTAPTAPFRFACPPEATLVTLVARQA